MPNYRDVVAPELGQLTAVQRPAPFGILRVRGPDAVDFVHRLSTQDVAAMAVGDARPAAFLTPKGKLETLAWIGRAADAVWIEAQAHEASRLAELLERYHFTEKLAIEARPDWACVQLLGSAAWADAAVTGPGVVADAEGVRLAGECRGLQWVRWHAPRERLPQLPRPELADAQWQQLRIAAGIAWVGTDVDGTNLGLEADIDDHVSTTKGCYTGQEIVARIHTYGHVNRKLVRVALTGADLPGPGAALLDEDGDAVGRLTSIAAPVGGRALALAFLPHELAVSGATVQTAAANVRVAVL